MESTTPNPYMVTAEAWAEEHDYRGPFALALVMADRLEHRLAGFASLAGGRP